MGKSPFSNHQMFQSPPMVIEPAADFQHDSTTKKWKFEAEAQDFRVSWAPLAQPFWAP